MHTYTHTVVLVLVLLDSPSVDCYNLNQWVLPDLWQVQRSSALLTTFGPSLAEETNSASL